MADCINAFVQIVKVMKKEKIGIGFHCVICYNFIQKFSENGEADYGKYYFDIRY